VFFQGALDNIIVTQLLPCD